MTVRVGPAQRTVKSLFKARVPLCPPLNVMVVNDFV